MRAMKNRTPIWFFSISLLATFGSSQIGIRGAPSLLRSVRQDGAFDLCAIRWEPKSNALASRKMRETNGAPSIAPTPPMGWNSWDSYGTTVREQQVKANADWMAQHLAKYGWQYIVVDIQWYEPNAQGHDYKPGAPLTMDE